MGENWIAAFPALLLIGLLWAYFTKSREADELRREREAREHKQRQEDKEETAPE